MNNVSKGLLIAAIAAIALAGCGAGSKETTNGETADNATTAAAPAPAEQAAEPAVEDPNAAGVVDALGENGTWLASLTDDVTVAEELVVEGLFYEEDDTAKPTARKLQLSGQGADETAAAAYTLTVPKMTVKSENFKIEGGTVKGDIYVEANGFYLDATATVDGDIYFPNQELKVTAQIYGKVTGLVR